MPRKKTKTRGRIETLTYDQEFNLLLGRGFKPECFESEAERKQAWFDFKDELLIDWHPDAPKPVAMRDYEPKAC